uniref:PROP1-like PPR domain-containing protein n=1 Tax=Globisporangium ultimum (strain ATCC 200006 / CBS 805.95 / DAOM BR144) TaxID=431595 RepID=K3W678_GLOUD
MAALLHFAATRSAHPLARALSLSHARIAQPLLLPAASLAWQQQQQQQQQRGISSTPALLKRKGGNSAFVVKSSQYKKKGLKTKHKLKQDVAPHKTHLEATRNLKSLEKDNLRNERTWDQLEQDEELNRELDAAFDYLNNLGAEGDYVYEPEPTLMDLDEKDALEKLNALARGDQDVLSQIELDEGDENDALSKQLAVEDYNFLLRVYAIKGLHKEANALLSRMEKNLQSTVGGATMFPPNETSTDMQLSSELDGVPHVIPPNAHSYMYYICALVNTKQAATAVRTLGRMKEKGVFPDIATYNAVMNVCAKANKVQWSYNIMEKMQVAGLVPDKASFTILMNAAIAENDVDKAFETFHLMRSHITEPDVVAFSCLIHGFAKIGRVERALNLLEDLLECGLTPTQVTFNSLINACAKSHYYAHKAIEFYNEMQELYDYIPDLYTYNTVLHACAKQGDFIQAEQIMRHMQKHHVPMDQVTYNTLLNVYARAQVKSVVAKAPRNAVPAQDPEELYQRPLEFDDDGNEIDLTRPGKEVSSLANLNYDGAFEDDEDDEDEDYDYEADESQGGELTKEELQQIEEIRKQDQLVVSDAEYFGAAGGEENGDFELKPMDLRDFGKFQSRNIARAEQWFYEMTVEKNMDVSAATLNSMLNVYANALRLRSAETFVSETFAKYDVQPDKYTYRVLMHMYVRGKRVAQAERVLETIKRKAAEGEIEADGVTFGLLVDLYARKRQLRRALVVLEDADAACVQVEEKFLKKIRKLTEKFGVFTDLIPEDPNAVIFAGTRHKLMEKRKVRAQVLAYNQKVGKRYLLPDTV